MACSTAPAGIGHGGIVTFTGVFTMGMVVTQLSPHTGQLNFQAITVST
jgi:hypothetical protein